MAEDTLTLEELLRSAGPYFQNGDGRPNQDPSTEEVSDRLELFGRLYPRLPSVVQRKHAEEIWTQWLKENWLTPQPWRLVQAAIKAGNVEALTGLSASPLLEQTLVDVEQEKVEWLWPGRIPLGKLTILDGDPGLGKSTIALDLAARVSTNGHMPDGTRGIVSDVLILSVEDGLADTIRPRLEAAGADLNRIHAITGKKLDDRSLDLVTISEDLGQIRELIQRRNIKFMVLDPLTAFIGDSINTWNEHHIRRALTPVAQMADEVGAAVLAIRHLKKTADKAINRGGGSIGIIALARSAMMLGTDPNDESVRVLAMTKSNLAAKPPSLRYTLAEASNGAVGVEWEGATDLSAEDIGQRVTQEERGAVDEAVEFLKESLRDGAQPTTKINSDAKSLGISEATVRRARKSLGIRARKEAIGKRRWLLELNANQ